MQYVPMICMFLPPLYLLRREICFPFKFVSVPTWQTLHRTSCKNGYGPVLHVCGVVKVQKDLFSDLQNSQKSALTYLLKKHSVGAVGSTEEDFTSTYTTNRESLIKPRKQDCASEIYLSSDFGLGWVTKVGLVWSITKYVLTEHRWSITRPIFESLRFLKFIECFWSLLAGPIGNLRR